MDTSRDSSFDDGDHAVDRNIVQARRWLAEFQARMADHDVRGAYQVFGETRSQLRAVKDHVPASDLLKYAAQARALAVTLERSPELMPTEPNAACNVWEAVHLAYERLAEREPANASHRLWASDARKRCDLAGVELADQLRVQR